MKVHCCFYSYPGLDLGKKPVLASKLSRFGVCQSGYLVIQTDLPNLDNKENGLLNSTVVFTLIQVWVQEKTSFGK